MNHMKKLSQRQDPSRAHGAYLGKEILASWEIELWLKILQNSNKEISKLEKGCILSSVNISTN